MFPQKKYYRQRAHSNPIADHCFEYPAHPRHFDWSALFPAQEECESNQYNGPDFVDVGCGYGGLLVELSPTFPDKKALGIEIRVKVCDYVQDRIKALRAQATGKEYNNIACLRGNAMKHLPNFFPKGSLEKMFFLFPDPHFKKQKHKWRIISQQLLSEYAFVLKEEARVYVATDVKDLFEWMTGHLNQHPLFERLKPTEEESDVVAPLLFDSTEEGKKVTRMGGNKYMAIFYRIPDPFGS